MKKMQIRMQLVCLFSMLLLFFPVELFAQQGTITGKGGRRTWRVRNRSNRYGERFY